MAHIMLKMPKEFVVVIQKKRIVGILKLVPYQKKGARIGMTPTFQI